MAQEGKFEVFAPGDANQRHATQLMHTLKAQVNRREIWKLHPDLAVGDQALGDSPPVPDIYKCDKPVASIEPKCWSVLYKKLNPDFLPSTLVKRPMLSLTMLKKEVSDKNHPRTHDICERLEWLIWSAYKQCNERMDFEEGSIATDQRLMVRSYEAEMNSKFNVAGKKYGDENCKFSSSIPRPHDYETYLKHLDSLPPAKRPALPEEYRKIMIQMGHVINYTREAVAKSSVLAAGKEWQPRVWHGCAKLREMVQRSESPGDNKVFEMESYAVIPGIDEYRWRIYVAQYEGSKLCPFRFLNCGVSELSNFNNEWSPHYHGFRYWRTYAIRRERGDRRGELKEGDPEEPAVMISSLTLHMIQSHGYWLNSEKHMVDPELLAKVVAIDRIGPLDLPQDLVKMKRLRRDQLVYSKPPCEAAIEYLGDVAKAKEEQPSPSRCYHCRQSPAVLKTCTGCRKVKYCGRECQLASWKAGHKQECMPSD